MNDEFKPFKINNPYLLKAMFGLGNIDNDILKNSHGCFLYDQFNLGRSFLEYCYSRIFNTHRLPGFEPEIYYSNRFEYYENYKNISEELIDDACIELTNLYNYTQEYFKSINLTSYTFYRMLSYFEVKEYLKQKNSTEDFVKLPTNILTFYSYIKMFSGYSSEYSLTRNIPVNKIVMIDFLLNDPYSSKGILYGEDEALVFDDSFDGFIQVDKTSIRCSSYK